MARLVFVSFTLIAGLAASLGCSGS